MMTDSDIDTEIQKTREMLGDRLTPEVERSARAFYEKYRQKPSDIVRSVALRILAPALEATKTELERVFGTDELENNNSVNEIACAVSACVARVFLTGCMGGAQNPDLAALTGYAVGDKLLEEIFTTPAHKTQA